MDNFVQYLSETPKWPSDAPASDRQYLFADDKADLDRVIDAKRRHGWVLVSRSYSMDKGHGALLAKRNLDQAA